MIPLYRARTGRIGSTLCFVLITAGCSGVGAFSSGNDQDISSLRLADRAAEQADYQTAAALYRREFAENPDSIDALVGLGRSYRNLGQAGRGEQALQEAAARVGDDPRILLELGRAQLANGRTREAIGTLSRALEQTPRNLRIITAYGIALDRISRHEDAQQVYQEGLRIDPTDFALLGNLALSRGLSGAPEEGIRILRELVRDSEADARTRGNLALLYGLAGREREARATLEGDLSEPEITENLSYYRELRELLFEGRAIGDIVAGGV